MPSLMLKYAQSKLGQVIRRRVTWLEVTETGIITLRFWRRLTNYPWRRFSSTASDRCVPVSAKGSTITFGISNNVDTLDPNVTTFSSVGVIMQHVFDPLVWQYPLGEFHPGLATEWSVNEDATEYTFKLRQGVTFHDGTPFNAEVAALIYRANHDKIHR